MEIRQEEEPVRGRDRGARSPSPGPEGTIDEEELWIREMIRLCYEDGILPSNIDPGEMSIEGREARFKVNINIDQAKVTWLKLHTVTFIFRDGTRFLPRKIKDDIVRAYEDRRTSDGTFDPNVFQRGRVKIESPNVISYVAKSTEVVEWLINKGSDNITLANYSYSLDFKPWLTKAQLRAQRREEDEATFWVIAVQVPLDAMIYLESHVRRAIGPMILTHPAEPDQMKPSLINIKFDLDLASRENMKDKIWIDTFEGDSFEVKLASSDTPRCRQCRAFFHLECECRRGNQQRGQESAAGVQASGVNAGKQAQSSAPRYNGPLGPRPQSPVIQAGGIQQQQGGVPSFNNIRFNPLASPGIGSGQGVFPTPVIDPNGANWSHIPPYYWNGHPAYMQHMMATGSAFQPFAIQQTPRTITKGQASRRRYRHPGHSSSSSARHSRHASASCHSCLRPNAALQLSNDSCS
ncbi:hypothetical protein CBR_g31576 [Chara braunii]|uniref:Uncharacterized protein n=1 Tax=Chara braunii TaxID=69332 RepID=A0A388LFC4_CHABU|nr:hypothetical protein CBR_g31576 [Chara braunii]|eukprot:GBG81020.1 hypothetical protein CBR_g31576 [Chara braunii]